MVGVQGYFTSRPALKGYIRVLSSYLQAARQLEVFATFGRMLRCTQRCSLRVTYGPTVELRLTETLRISNIGTMMQLAPGVSSATTRKLEEAMGIAQHHDAASGTAQQHVTNDYAARLVSFRCVVAKREMRVCAATRWQGVTLRARWVTLRALLGDA
jgi:alpha-mannosidase